ncbi:MAG: hypothetical protein WC397_02575 [Candidatus Paceibacterota bacterium]|jgi:ribosomal protein L7Ae-like RNA K-turn-binding protein
MQKYQKYSAISLVCFLSFVFFITSAQASFEGSANNKPVVKSPNSAAARPATSVDKSTIGGGSASASQGRSGAIDRAGEEAGNRIAALGKLSEKLNQMKKISEDQKIKLQAEIQEAINNLTALKTKIDSDTDPEALKSDIQSIAKEYRVYMLVVPRIQILAAVERVNATAEMLGTISQKLQTRLSQLPQGSDISALQTALTDFNAKIFDAKTQAQAAADAVIDLAPDNGDKAVLEKNNQALKTARAALQAAQKDLVSARKDASDIVKGMKELLKSNRSVPASSAPVE